MSETMRLFNRRSVRRHRDRAAPGFAAYDFLLNEVGERLADRLDDINRRFPVALDLGCHGGEMGRLLAGRGGIETLIQCDLSPAMAGRAAAMAADGDRRTLTLGADEEALPFAGGGIDLIISCLSLHWVNDLPGALTQIRAALKPDGLFLAALLGGETLKELRAALIAAEVAGEGGASPRVSPFAEVREAGNLLGRAGFALPVADIDTITVSFESPLKLMADLRGMGESNALSERRQGFTRRATLFDAAARYTAEHGDGDGRVPCTFQVVYLTAWAPDASQQKPLKPGSAETSLAEALGSTEITPGGQAEDD